MTDTPLDFSVQSWSKYSFTITAQAITVDVSEVRTLTEISQPVGEWTVVRFIGYFIEGPCEGGTDTALPSQPSSLSLYIYIKASEITTMIDNSPHRKTEKSLRRRQRSHLGEDTEVT